MYMGFLMPLAVLLVRQAIFIISSQRSVKVSQIRSLAKVLQISRQCLYMKEILLTPTFNLNSTCSQFVAPFIFFFLVFLKK